MSGEDLAMHESVSPGPSTNQAEIAQAMAVPPGMVAGWISAAKRRLRDALGEARTPPR